MKKFELCETAEYCVMADDAEEDPECNRWPTAPDGYIPNSIIRSWRKKQKSSSGEDFWQQFFSTSVYIELGEEEERTADEVFYCYFDVDEIDIPAEMERKKSVRDRSPSTRKSSRVGKKPPGRKVSVKPKTSQKRKESEYGSDMQPRRSLKTSRRSLVSQKSGQRRSGK